MPPITKLPLDLYGTSTTNRVVGEEHIVDSLATNIFALDKGPFYSHPSKFTIYSVTLQRNLTPMVDYICLNHYQELTQKTGHEVMCAVMITNPEAYGTLQVTAQMVGGPYQNLVDVLIDMIEHLDIDNRPVNWGDIIGLPELFNPADHLHHIDDTYGWEYVADAIDNVTQAILVGNQASMMELAELFRSLHQDYMNALDGVQQQLHGHEEAIGNPHQLTKVQFGIEKVPNYPMSTKVISEARTSNEHFMSPLQVSYLLDVHPTTTGLTAHLAATNPHNITKNTVGLGNVVNYGVAVLADFNAGATDKYVVASLLKTVDDNNRTYTGSAISTAMTNHLAASNPHNITKTTVGLSNVQNYGIGGITDFNAGASNKYVDTSLLKWLDGELRSTINTSVSSSMSAHLAATNPHNVTKTTVGLGNVQNYAVATLSDFNSAATDKYVTASLAKTIDNNREIATNLKVANAIGDHLAAQNPHGITKTTVGLNNVLNYGTSSVADAIAGLREDVWTTPAGVKAAVQNAPGIRLFQGRSSVYAALEPGDRTSLGLGETSSVKFQTVSSGNTITSGSSLRRLEMISGHTAAGGDHAARFRELLGSTSRNNYLPWAQQDTHLNVRMMATSWMQKPYVFGKEIDVPAGSSTFSFDPYSIGYGVLKILDTNATALSLTIVGNGPDAYRDKFGTDMDDGRNEWLYGQVLCFNPRNRTVSWTNVNWGDNGAPELKPNSWNYIVLLQSLTYNAQDNATYFSGWRGFPVGTGY